MNHLNQLIAAETDPRQATLLAFRRAYQLWRALGESDRTMIDRMLTHTIDGEPLLGLPVDHPSWDEVRALEGGHPRRGSRAAVD